MNSSTARDYTYVPTLPSNTNHHDHEQTHDLFGIRGNSAGLGIYCDSLNTPEDGATAAAQTQDTVRSPRPRNHSRLRSYRSPIHSRSHSSVRRLYPSDDEGNFIRQPPPYAFGPPSRVNTARASRESRTSLQGLPPFGCATPVLPCQATIPDACVIDLEDLNISFEGVALDSPSPRPHLHAQRPEHTNTQTPSNIETRLQTSVTTIFEGEACSDSEAIAPSPAGVGLGLLGIFSSISINDDNQTGLDGQRASPLALEQAARSPESIQPVSRDCDTPQSSLAHLSYSSTPFLQRTFKSDTADTSVDSLGPMTPPARRLCPFERTATHFSKTMAHVFSPPTMKSDFIGRLDSYPEAPRSEL